MNYHLTRLVLVFVLALMASAARGDDQPPRVPPEEPQSILAGMGFASFPETAPKEKESSRIIFSDEEVEIVDLSEPAKK